MLAQGTVVSFSKAEEIPTYITTTSFKRLERFLNQGSNYIGIREHMSMQKVSKKVGRPSLQRKLLLLLELLQRLMVVAAAAALVPVCKRPYLALLAFCRRKMGTLLLLAAAVWWWPLPEKASLPTDSEGQQGGGSFKHTGLFWALFLIS